MKLKIRILALLLSINCYAHKEVVFKKNYGNVKIFMKTGFEYLDVEKIKIVGQLSEKLSERLQYNDTILIEYIQDYTDKYVNDFYMLEDNNTNLKIFSGLEFQHLIKSNNSGSSVRIYANRINIVDVLKLVEFTINNHKNISSYLTEKEIEVKNHKGEILNKKIASLVTEDDLINQIFNSNSELVNEIISEKIPIITHELYGIEIYWKNNNFLFEYNDIHRDKQELIYKIKDYFYHRYINVNQIVVFVDKKHFYYLNGSRNNNIELIKIENDDYVPLKFVEFGNKVLIHPYWSRNELSIFFKEKNKVISKIE